MAVKVDMGREDWSTAVGAWSTRCLEDVDSSGRDSKWVSKDFNSRDGETYQMV